MGLKKGTTNNPAGRKKGTPNKLTADLRQRINEVLENNWQNIEADIKALEPKDRLMFIEKLLKYTLPTLQATSLNVDFEKLSDEQLDKIIDELKKTFNDE
jgi:hypothetical protein